MDFGALVAHATQGQLAYLEMESAYKAQTDARVQLERDLWALQARIQLLQAVAATAKGELEAVKTWLDGNMTFFKEGDQPVLKGKRIWYHATNDENSYPFSSLVGK